MILIAPNELYLVSFFLPVHLYFKYIYIPPFKLVFLHCKQELEFDYLIFFSSLLQVGS